MELHKGELIKDILGYEGLYAITTHGRVWSYPKSNSDGKIRHYGKWLSGNPNGKGYLGLILVKDNIKTKVRIARLVALTFIPNPENKETVNHKDFNRTNNHISNLEWATRSEQELHKTSSEHYVHPMQGKQHPASRKIIDITSGEIFVSTKDASLKTGANLGHISSCANGKRGSAGKTVDGKPRIWKYITE